MDLVGAMQRRTGGNMGGNDCSPLWCSGFYWSGGGKACFYSPICPAITKYLYSKKHYLLKEFD